MQNPINYVILKVRYFLDLGNTQLKLATLQNQHWVRLASFSSVNECLAYLKNAPVANEVYLVSVTNAHEALAAYFNTQSINLKVFDPTQGLPFKIIYEGKSLGHDRIVTTAGAQGMFSGFPVLVIDAGTCIKYQLLTPDNVLYPGPISPGMQLRLNAMNQFTSALPPLKFNPDFTKSTVINTSEAIWSGAQRGAVMEVKGFIEDYSREWPDIKIVFTGGHAAYLSAQFKNRYFESPDLIFYGLHALFNLTD